ncbi:hypothetical protein ACVWXU_001161 [Streptomyces sp. TE33382]
MDRLPAMGGEARDIVAALGGAVVTGLVQHGPEQGPAGVGQAPDGVPGVVRASASV